MAITIDYSNQNTPQYIINIPKTDMTDVTFGGPTEIRQLNIDDFRKILNDLMDDEKGMVFPTNHVHTAPLTVAGVTLARVVEILTPYVVLFEDGLYNVNIVGGNSNIADKTIKNQVGVNTANSAGLTYSKQVEDQSFTDARVWIDIDAGTPGTSFPLGTPGSPVNNLADAQTIIVQRTLPNRIHLRGALVVGSGESIDNYDIVGDDSKLASINFITGASNANSVFRAMILTGDLNGSITARDVSSFSSIADFEGRMIKGGLAGTISLANTDADDIVEFVDCFSNVAGTSTPIIDAAGISGLQLNLRGYHGGLQVSGFNGPNMAASLDVDSANILIDSSCVSGTIVIRGVGHYTDNSGPNCNVIVSGLVTPQIIGSGGGGGGTPSSMEVLFLD